MPDEKTVTVPQSEVNQASEQLKAEGYRVIAKEHIAGSLDVKLTARKVEIPARAGRFVD